MYKKEDFNNLFWNPMLVEKDVRKAWNTLNLYKEFNDKLFKSIDEDKFFNYMQLVYHKDSVFVKDYESLNDRKQRALEFVGIKQKNGKFPTNYQEVIDGENKVANRMIIRFCTLQRNQEHSLLQILGTNYDRLLFRLAENSENEDIDKAVEMAAKTTKDLSQMLKQIKELKELIFMSDKKISDEVDDMFVEYARIAGYPELIMNGDIKVSRN